MTNFVAGSTLLIVLESVDMTSDGRVDPREANIAANESLLTVDGYPSVMEMGRWREKKLVRARPWGLA